jgi:hypothetical protein
VLEKGYRVPRPAAYPPLRDLVSIPSIEFGWRDANLEALGFWKDHSPLSFADCFHLVLAKQLGMECIYTFDKKMDRFPGVERVEPEWLPPLPLIQLPTCSTPLTGLAQRGLLTDAQCGDKFFTAIDVSQVWCVWSGVEQQQSLRISPCGCLSVLATGARGISSGLSAPIL